MATYWVLKLLPMRARCWNSSAVRPRESGSPDCALALFMAACAM